MTIGDWMETPSGAKILGYAFGFGASVVIVGALFKIQHWPGSSYVLTGGMGVEALLFALSAFGKPHPTYHWDHVFPQLKEDSDLEGITSFGGGGGHGTSSSGGSVNAEALEGVASLSDEDVQKLSAGIAKLTETASQLSEVSSVKSVTEKFVNNMSEANESISSFNSIQAQINESTTTLVDSYQRISGNIATASQSTDGFISSMDSINKNLSSINAVYEMQLKVVENQATAVTSVTDEWNKVTASVSSISSEVDDYKAETAKLKQQVSNLNSVYGSMLNAVSSN